MKISPLISILFALSCGLAIGQDVKPDSHIVSSRLVKISPSDVTSYTRADTSLTGKVLFEPETAEVLEVDRQLSKILNRFGSNMHSERKFFKENISTWTAPFSYCYGGQFLGCKNEKGERVLVCTYYLLADIESFHRNTEIAWPVAEKIENKNGGSIFQFRFNLATKTAGDFKIHDAKDHLFGEKKLESLGRAILPQRAFTISKDSKFSIQLGRGSGMHGLHLVKINNKGVVDFYRINGDYVQFQLTDGELNSIIDAANREKLTGMKRIYSSEILDGSQWILWIVQNGKRSATYFNNNFPQEIIKFAETVDKQLRVNDRRLKFTPSKSEQDHAKQIWDAIH